MSLTNKMTKAANTHIINPIRRCLYQSPSAVFRYLVIIDVALSVAFDTFQGTVDAIQFNVLKGSGFRVLEGRKP